MGHAEKQASWRERNLKNENGTELRAQFILDASARAQLKRVGCQKGCSVTSLIKEWAASAVVPMGRPTRLWGGVGGRSRPSRDCSGGTGVRPIPSLSGPAQP
jgi:hypothetical protein